MDTVSKDESTENLDIRQILDIKELQRIQDLFLTVTGMTAAVVDMKRKIHYERKLLYQLLQQVYQWKT